MLAALRRPRRSRSLLLALPAALMAVALMAGSASAVIYTHKTGMVGPWSFDDQSLAPSVICSYGATIDNNHYFMTKIKVGPPMVYAADRDPSKVDTRRVSWQFQIQRKHQPDGHWVVVDGSAVQKGTATENAPAMFTALTLKHNGHQAGSDTEWTVRIQVLIKWYKPSGAVEGTVLFRPSYYSFKSPDFTGTSSQHWCQEIETSG